MALDYRERKELRDYLEERRLGRRLQVVRVAVTAMFSLLLALFWYLQVVEGEEFARMAEHNALRREVVPPLRGRIFDRRGRLLASNRPGFNVYWNRERVRRPDETERALAPLLGMQPGEIGRLLEAADRRPRFQPVLLSEGAGFPVAAAVDARRLELVGIGVQEEPVRVYEQGGLTAHVVGYLREASERDVAASAGVPERARQVAPGDLVGKIGIERVYDRRMRGAKGLYLLKVDSFGRRLGIAEREAEPAPGEDVRLTIDLELQRAFAEALGDRQGAGVFLDPRDGAVLALASAPSFDPNLFSGRFTREEWQGLTDDPRHPLQNRALHGLYSPGSTFKLVVAAAGIESGVITSSTRAWCPGHTKHYGRKFRCWKRGGHGWVNLDKAIRESCNIFFYKVGKELGVDTLADWSARFGLGRAVGIDLGRDEAGTVPSKAWKQRTLGQPWYPGETISVAIGQGYLESTPLQLARMAAAFANGGRLVRPFLASSEAGGGEAGPDDRVEILPATMERLRDAMEAVVNDQGGTGWRCRLPDVRVAGKTGTVQLVSQVEGEEGGPEDHSWFLGYAPADDPRIAFAVIVEHGGDGSLGATLVARKVLEAFFEDEERPPAAADQVARASIDP